MHDQSTHPVGSPIRPIALLAIAATTVAAGGIVGATTNAINGAVSPVYFQSTLSWADVKHLWRASLAMGIFAGLSHGLVFSAVFTLVVGIVSKAQCTFASALRTLLTIITGVYICWVLGGLIGMGLAALSPDFFRHTFPGVPELHGQMLRYAWVGGSIWGATAGGVLGLVIGSILFAVRWRRTQGTAESCNGGSL